MNVVGFLRTNAKYNPSANFDLFIGNTFLRDLKSI